VDGLARELGERYEDTRLLVSELVTAAIEWLDDTTAPRVQISINRISIRVELRYDDAGEMLEEPVLGEWIRMLLKALTSGWGTSDGDGVCLWFEILRG
jgi:hypothetical protein